MKQFDYPPSTEEYRSALSLLNDIWHDMIRYDLEGTPIFEELTEFLGLEDDE